MADRNYGAIRTADRVEQFTQRIIDQKKPFGFDIEAGYTGEEKEGVALMQFHPDYIVVGISFTNSTEWARYIPVGHDDDGNVDDLVRTARALWRMLWTKGDDGQYLGVAHNVSYEIKGLRQWFKKILGNDPELGEEVMAHDGFFPFLTDTMVEVWLAAEYDPLRIGKDLKSVCLAAFGMQMDHFPDLFPAEDSELGAGTPRTKKKYIRFNTRNSRSKRIIDYACEDSVGTLMLYEKHHEALKDNFVYKIEMQLVRVLIEMEIEGMYLDWAQISKKAAEVAEFRDMMNEEILAELSRRLDRTLNLNLASPLQLQKILFDPKPEGLGLPIKIRSEKTQQPSTGEEALRAIAKADPIIKNILEWRELNKLYGSYLHKYETDLNYVGNNYAYPNHNQAGALTGRLSVDHVSYQQWPKPYHYKLLSGKTFDLNFRDLLIAPKGFRIIGYDFSQVELRVLAGVSNETAMLKAFADDVDIHRATAASMFRIPVEEVTKDLRAKGKTGNFAVVYGSGAQNMADMMGTTKAEAEELLKAYYAGFPNLRKWMDKSIATGREQGYVETLFGRKFTVWEYKSTNDYIRSKGDRMCVNAPIQGGAADYMKIGMVRVNKALKKAVRDGVIPADSVRLIMTVHDALEFYVRDDVLTQTVIDIVTPAVSFPVKELPEIRTDWHEGYKWGSVAEIKLDKTTKKIRAFGLEDVDEEFVTLEEALAYLEKKNAEKEALNNPEPEIVEAHFEPEWTDEMVQDLASSDDGEPPWLHAKEEFPVELDPIFSVKTERIKVREMPDETQFAELKKFFLAHVGQNRVVLSLPEGDMTMPYRVKLLNADTPALSLILNGAQVFQEPEGVFIGVEKAEAVGN